MRRAPIRQILVICFLFVTPTICVTTTSAADSHTYKEAEQLARQFVTEYEKQVRLRAENRLYEPFLTWLAQHIGADPSASDHLLVRVNQGIAKDETVSLAGSNIPPLFASVSRLSEESTRDLTSLRDSWMSKRTAANFSDIEAFDLKQQKQLAGQLASLLNADNKWLWACALLSVVGLIVAYSHAQRHRIRRLFWVKRSRYIFVIVTGVLLVGVILIPTAIIFLFGNTTYDALISAQSRSGEHPPRGRLNAEINEIRAIIENDELVSNNQQYKRDLQSKLNELNQKLEPFVNPNNHELLDDWSSFKLQTIQLQVEREIYDAFIEEIKTEQQRVDEKQTSLADVRQSLGSTRNRKYVFAAGMGFLMFFGFGSVAFAYSRKVSKLESETALTCPSCLNVGSLVEETNNLGTSILRCNATYLTPSGEELCDFAFNSSYASHPKFSFPTLGVAASGKTHWMAMIYRLLNHSQAPSGVNFERLKSPQSQKFDRIVNEILNKRKGVDPTTIGDRIPFPLTFLFRDNDGLSKSRLLVSLFDYGGRITIDQSLWQRGRALNADGYFFFLDPTKRSDEQVEALNLFREDVRDVKRVPEGRQLDRPVALCLSKLDLMPNRPYASGGNLIEEFYSELRQLDAEHPQMTMELIRLRAELTESLLPIVFPGWNVVETVRELFGPRVTVFPMTPVGLQNPGEDDLSKVTIDSYAILEPLMWLLHMNGYPILRKH